MKKLLVAVGVLLCISCTDFDEPTYVDARIAQLEKSLDSLNSELQCAKSLIEVQDEYIYMIEEHIEKLHGCDFPWRDGDYPDMIRDMHSKLNINYKHY